LQRNAAVRPRLLDRLPVAAFHIIGRQRRDFLGFLLLDLGRIEFLPELLAVFRRHPHGVAQPFVMTVEHERLRRPQALLVSCGDAVADRHVGDPRNCRQHGAGGEADEIQHVGHLGGFVEVVDAPDEPPLRVAPGAEVLDMDVADRQRMRCALELRARGVDRLGPAPIGGAQELERVGRHLLVFGVQVVLDHIVKLSAQPVFVLLGGMKNVHGAPRDRGNSPSLQENPIRSAAHFKPGAAAL